LKYVLAGDESKVKLLTKKPAKLQEQANEALEKAKKMKEKAKTKEEKIAATEKDLAAKALKKEAADAKYQAAHLTAKVPNQTALGKKIETWNDKIKKMELNIKHKDDNKEVSLGTSKVSVE
jgi:DNA topoisomerase I